MAVPLVLASASPRRRELLQQLGFTFEVIASEIPEIPQPGESAEAFVQRAAREKAFAVASTCRGRFVLGADTAVVMDGAIFGKPGTRDEARAMLRALSGRIHRVLTGVALVDPAGRLDQAVVASEVEFRRIEAAEIERYLDSGEPYDKAGAYAVQGLAGRFVVQVRGSFSNVVGLPIDEVRDLLRRHFPVQPGQPA